MTSDQLQESPGGAVVIGSDYRQLGLVRSLGRHGVPVWVLTDDHWLCGLSRFARRALAWPGGDEAERVGFLTELSERYDLRRWALFPGEDRDAALIANHHTDLSRHYTLTTPPWRVLRSAYDKRLTYELARELGIDHPLTFYPRDRRDLESLDCEFPVILKPAFKDRTNALTTAKAWRVDDRAQLLRRYDEARTFMDPSHIIVQELIPGGGALQFSYGALCEAGRPVASLVARRARQWPIEFGRSSTFVETLDLPEVERLAERLLEAIGFSGLVEVEFKRDPRSGSYKLLDVNPRIWGWQSVGRAAGVDFGYLAWSLAQGRSPSRARGRPGARWVHGVTDVPMVMIQIARGHLSPWDYLRSIRPPVEPAVFALDDPLPALVELPMVLYLLWRRRQEFSLLLPRPLAESRKAE